MPIRYLWILVFIICQNQLYGQSRRLEDTVFLRYDQRVLGEVLSLSQGRLNIDTDIDGEMNIKFFKIHTFSARSHFYRIRMADRRILYGHIESIDSLNHVMVIEGYNRFIVPISSIIRMQRYDESFLERLSGSFSLGYNYTRSGDLGRINFDTGLKYFNQKMEMTLNASTLITQDEGEFSRDIENIAVSLTRFIGYSLFYSGKFSIQRNVELSLERRFNEIAGFGYILIQKSQLQWYVSSGISMSQELSTEGNRTGNLLEIPLLNLFRLYRFKNPDIRVELDQTIFYGITQTGRIRSDNNLRISWEPFNDFVISNNFYLNSDTDPLEETAETVDFGFVITFGYSFY